MRLGETKINATDNILAQATVSSYYSHVNALENVLLHCLRLPYSAEPSVLALGEQMSEGDFIYSFIRSCVAISGFINLSNLNGICSLIIRVQ